MKFLRHLIVAVLTFIAVNASANHILGGDITYECIGNDEYVFTLNLYVDCFGATAAPVEENIFFEPQCGFLFSALATWQSTTEISDLCATELPNSSCNGGFIPGTWLVTYTTDPIELTEACPWNITWGAGDWNYFINMDNALLPTATFETVIDLTNPQCGESVNTDGVQHVPYVCMGDPVSYNVGVNNPEGYDLTYSFVDVLTTGAVSAPYEAGFTGNEPIPGITIDPVTGQIDFVAPMQFGSYSVGVLVEMFDGGVFVGSVLESIAFIVRPCIQAPTVFDPDGVDSLATALDGNLINPGSLELCIGDSVCFYVEASNANQFRTLFLVSDLATVLPDADFSVTGLNPTIGEVCLLGQESNVGTQTVTFDVTDDDCIFPGADQLQIDVTVNPSLSTAFTDTLDCLASPIQLGVEGDTQYTWSVISGDPIDVPTNFSCNDCGDPIVSPATTTVYEVIGDNVPPNCIQADTITVAVALSSIDTLQTIESCAGLDGAIDLTVLEGSGNFSYSWSGPNGFNAITEDINGLDGGDYDVTITDNDIPGCTADYSVFVDSIPPPDGEIVNTDLTICAGECVDIEFDLSGTGPFDLNLTGAADQLDVNDGFLLNVCPAATTTYTLNSVTDNNAPACTTPVNSSFTVTVRPVVTATFDNPSDLCAGDSQDLLLEIDQTGLFDVDYTDGTSNFTLNGVQDGDLVSVNPATTTTYTITEVRYPDGPTCPNTNPASVTLTVNPLPTAVLGTNQTICIGDQATLEFTLTGNGPFDVDWNDGTNNNTEVNVADGHTVLVNPAVTTEYCISEITDNSTPACTQTIDSCVEIAVNDLPTATLASDATICEGDAIDLEIGLTGSGPFDVEYTANGAGNVVLDDIDDGNLESVSPIVDTEYCLISVSDSNNPVCTNAINECVDITVNTPPTADITGNSSICENECVDIPLSLTGNGPFTVNWEIEALDDGTITPQADLVGVVDGDTFQVCTDESIIVRVTGVGDSNAPVCSDDEVSDYDITVVPYSTISLSEDSTICAGGDGLLLFEINGDGGPYDFTFEDAGGAQTPILGITPADLDASNIYSFTVNPAATDTYTLISFVDGSNTCTQFSGTATISVSPIPTADLLQDVTICMGDDVDLELDLGGIGPFDITVSDGVVDTQVDGIADGYLYNVSPAATTTYTLTNVVDQGSTAECAITPNIDLSVTVVAEPTVSNLDTLCDNTGENFQITFEISGGDPASFAVAETGIGPGAISAGPPYIYTSDFIPSGSSVSFDVTDGNACGVNTIEIDLYSCPILTDAGTMDVTALDICESDEAIAVFNNDEFLDANDQQMFILHDNPGGDLGVVLAVDCDDSGFNDADSPLIFGTDPGEVNFETVYYISSVAGNDDGTGDCVDLNHPNISIAPGTPVIFHEEPVAEISGGATICDGDSTELQVDFTGVGPWTFTPALEGVDLDDLSTSDNPFTFFVQDAGLYTISAVNNNFCDGTSQGDATVNVNPLPTATIGADGEICEGQVYQLDVNLTGTPDWTVDLVQLDDMGNEVATISDVSPVSPLIIDLDEDGDYFVSSVTDGNGCTNDQDSPVIELIVNELPTASITLPDSTICEGSFIDIPIQLSGSSPWDIDLAVDAAVIGTFTEANDTLIYSTDQPGLVEVLSVTDANNCTSNSDADILISTVPIPVADAGSDLTVCSGVDIQIGTAEQANLSYSWEPSEDLSDSEIAQPILNTENISGAPIILGLTLTVSEAFCSDTDEVEVSVQSAPLADAGPDQDICYDATTTLEANGGINCSWEANPSLSDPSICDPTVNTLVTDTFIVEIEGANGCFATDSVVVNVPEELLIEVVDFSEELCFGACDGLIELEANGGYAPYTFTLTYPDLTTATGTSFENLCAGIYEISLEDDNGCLVTQELEILELAEYTIEEVVVSGDVCFGESTGTITVTSPEAVQFSLNNGESQAPNIADGIEYTGLPAGPYTILATDAIGCATSEDVVIGSFDEITFEVDDASVLACYQEAVNLGAEAVGGSGVFTYFWMTESETPFDQGEDISFVPSNPINLLSYAVDENGCSSDTLEVEVTFNPPFEATLTPSITQFICQGESITLSAELSGGNGFPAPQWTAIYSGEVVSNQTTFTVTPGNDELYELEVSDGCTQPLLDTISVVVMDIPNVQIGFDTIAGCTPVEVQLTNDTESEMIGTCEWDLGDGTIIPACEDTVNYVFVDPGSYDVSLTITSTQGCTNTGFLPSPVQVYPYPEADFSWNPDPPTILENELEFVNETSLGSTFEWDFGILGSSLQPNPELRLPAVDQGAFPVCLIAITPFGCSDTICKLIEIESQVLLYVPTAFTPDDDGVNDVFVPVISGVEQDDFVFRVFNRWGEVIFETTIIGEGWQGNYVRNDFFVQNEVYTWQIICKLLGTGEEKEYYGHVTLIR